MLKLRIDLGPAAKTNVSGVGQYTKRLAEALNANPGVEITGFYFDWQCRYPKPKVKIRYASINFPKKVYTRLHKLGFKFAFDRKMDQVDATIFPNFATWPTKKSTLRITTIHDLTYLRFPKTVEKKNLAYLKKIVPKTLKQANLILTVSETVKQEIMQEFGVANERILTLPVPPDQTFLGFKPSPEPLAPTLKITTKYFLLFVGNFEPRKNLAVLVKAFLKLPAQAREKLSLVIAGGRGWENDKVQILIDHAVDNGENIVQTGNLDQEQIAQLMHESLCLVMPSLYEGFGMPIVEAMALAKPIIAADIPVLHETSQEIALFFKTKSAKSLAEAIIKLCKNPSLQKRLGEKGQAYAHSLSWAANAEAIFQKINQLLEQKLK